MKSSDRAIRSGVANEHFVGWTGIASVPDQKGKAAMKKMSRRDVLSASAGAMVAVPMAALLEPGSAAAHAAASDAHDRLSVTDGQPVMFCVHNAKSGEVSILHGDEEVIIHDRRLVSRILQAAKSSRGRHVVTS